MKCNLESAILPTRRAQRNRHADMPGLRALQTKTRIVIFRLGSLGDTIVTLPCFHKVAELAPYAKRLVLCNRRVSAAAPSIESVLGGSGLIDGTLEYPGGTRSWKDIVDLAQRLRALDTDTLVYLTESRDLISTLRDVAFFRLCGFNHIIGAPLQSDLRRPRRIHGTDEIEHECERLARCVAELGPINLQDRAMWDLRLSAEERAAGMRAIVPLSRGPFIAINTGGKLAAQDWGAGNWLALIQRLTADLPTHGLLIVGGNADSARAQQLARAWHGCSLNACGQLTPRETAAALHESSLFIGHDSGPLHLAAAMDATCVGLFGSNSWPRRWHPFGSRHRVIHRLSGMSAITVDEVVALVHDRLANGK